MNSWTALELFQPDPELLYPIEAAARLACVPRRLIALYCRHGLVSPIMDPESGGWFFNDDGVRALRRIEYLRAVCDMNLTAIGMIMRLSDEVERLREEIRILRPV